MKWSPHKLVGTKRGLEDREPRGNVNLGAQNICASKEDKGDNLFSDKEMITTYSKS